MTEDNNEKFLSDEELRERCWENAQLEILIISAMKNGTEYTGKMHQ